MSTLILIASYLLPVTVAGALCYQLGANSLQATRRHYLAGYHDGGFDQETGFFDEVKAASWAGYP